MIKICGLRRVEDAKLSLELGASLLGCVMAGDSPRCASVAEVQAIVEGRGLAVAQAVASTARK